MYAGIFEDSEALLIIEMEIVGAETLGVESQFTQFIQLRLQDHGIEGRFGRAVQAYFLLPQQVYDLLFGDGI